MNKNNMSFTKEHTQIAKGIAILFMVYHHLFVIPERLNNEYINLLDINGVNFQSIIANFCKICVCIYIFLSGYGFFLSLKNTNSILQMYKKSRGSCTKVHEQLLDYCFNRIIGWYYNRKN